MIRSIKIEVLGGGTARDDFSEAVKRTIANRVGNRCSRQGCEALTSGPQVDPTKSLNVGVAAHITAASPGGPRYDPNLSAEARQHPDNGIWLCQTCAKLVDNDAVRFPADRLRAWKVEAEAKALEMIGKTHTKPKQPDLRLDVKPALTLDPHGTVFPLLTVTAQNHGTNDVFLQSIALELKSGDQFFYPRDSVTGEYQRRRQLRPGESFTIHLDLQELVRHRVSPDVVIGAIARDAIDRVYRSTEENFPELVRHVLQRDERVSRG